MSDFKKPKIHYYQNWPDLAELGSGCLIIADQRFEDHLWIQDDPFCYFVKSGEELKDLRGFAEHIERILALVDQIPQRPLKIVGMGGGSVGDFAGFVASVLKRGVGLIHVPSTWLSAVDSAHGGKTALNVGGIKNQIGTFYPAQEIFLIRPLLQGQPQERLHDVLGEVLKICLIHGGDLWKKISKLPELEEKHLWKFLPDLIEAKYQIVKKDPQEKTGTRHILNLGHTIGHVIEAEAKLTHGRAIFLGLQFALAWSRHLKIMTEKTAQEIGKTQMGHYLLDPAELKKELRSLENIRELLSQDKKRVESGLRFVFLKAPGHCVVKTVTIDEIVAEVKRQAAK
jgi:3-dehydroquinate synthase